MSDESNNQNSEGQIVMPFYILCDVSGSMSGDMADLNKALGELHQQLLNEPIINDLVMMSIITFNHGAQTVVPLAAPVDIVMPTLSASGLTDYGPPLTEFNRAFTADRARLKKEGKRVFRPCIYFLTDGEPNTQGYKQVFTSLIAKENNPAYPYICAFGFRDATEATLKTIAYPNFGDDGKRGRWFIARDGATITQVLTAMASALAQSILQSAHSASNGPPVVSLPQSVQGMGGSFV